MSCAGGEKPLAVDMFCGLGGWTEGLLAAGFRVVGFDIERHTYGPNRYPAQLVLQDVLTIHGSQFRDAALIVASPPCQNYSYLAMPWSRSKDPENSKAAKALRKKWETEGPDNRLFNACFRIQREAIEATRRPCPACDGRGQVTWTIADVRDCERCAGGGTVTRYIPLVVENVRGAVPWVGRQAAQFGSFYLWGDVAQVGKRVIVGRDLADIRAGRGRFGMGAAPERHPKGGGQTWFAREDGTYGFAGSDARKVAGFCFDGSGRSFQTASVEAHAVAVKTPGRSLNKGGKKFGTHHMGSGEEIMRELATKQGGDWFGDMNGIAKHGSRSNARKAASALIAKIPPALSEYVGRMHFPGETC